MDAHDVVEGHGQQAKGIVVAKVGLARKGQVLQVIQAAHVAGLDAGRVEGRR